MAQYVHMYRPHIYEEIIRQDFYYPFKMECDLITACVGQLGEKLQDITEALELDPGSRTPIVSKTVPFLKSLRSEIPISVHKAIDVTKEYAEQACTIIQEYFNDIKTGALEINFPAPNAFQEPQECSCIKGRKLIIGFGQPIFANNNDGDIHALLKNISFLLNDVDYLVFGTDTNSNKNLIEEAYSAEIIHELLFNVMYHLKQVCQLDEFDPKAFEWDEIERVVRLSLKATLDQTFNIGNQEFLIRTGDEFNILNSQKPETQKIVEFLHAQNLALKEAFSLGHDNHNTFSLFIVQKISAKSIQELPKFSNVA